MFHNQGNNHRWINGRQKTEMIQTLSPFGTANQWSNYSFHLPNQHKSLLTHNRAFGSVGTGTYPLLPWRLDTNLVNMTKEGHWTEWKHHIGQKWQIMWLENWSNDYHENMTISSSMKLGVNANGCERFMFSKCAVLISLVQPYFFRITDISHSLALLSRQSTNGCWVAVHRYSCKQTISQ